MFNTSGGLRVLFESDRKIWKFKKVFRNLFLEISKELDLGFDLEKCDIFEQEYGEQNK